MTPEQYNAGYDTPRGRWIGNAEYGLVPSLLAVQPCDAVLDMACGTGWFTRRVAGEGAQVIGLDRDAGALAFAGRHSAGCVSCVHGDATEPPFADATFDAVLSVTARCFVEQWPKAVAEIGKALRRLPVCHVQCRYGVLLPSGSDVTCALERSLSSGLPVGSFVAVAGDIGR